MKIWILIKEWFSNKKEPDPWDIKTPIGEILPRIKVLSRYRSKKSLVRSLKSKVLSHPRGAAVVQFPSSDKKKTLKVKSSPS